MSKFIAILAAGAAVALATPALAQDAPQDDYANGMSGFKIGAEIGYDQTRAGSSAAVIYDHRKIDGVMYGATAGYDLPIGRNVVIGPEVEWTDGNAKTGYSQPSFGFGSVSNGRDLYAGGRLGFVISPHTMVYAKGGYTDARYHIRANDGTNDYRDDIGVSGYRVGAGVEVAPTARTFARFEYRYSNYGRGRVEYGGTSASSTSFDIDTDRHQVVAAVGVRF
jgi:outer membrane immunogenic protein